MLTFFKFEDRDIDIYLTYSIGLKGGSSLSKEKHQQDTAGEETRKVSIEKKGFKTHTAVLNKIGFSGINSINLFLDPVLRSGIINCKNISYLQQP